MADGHLDSVLQHVRGLAAGSGPEPDRELLERFVDQGDEAAFATLFQRHRPLVLTLCRRLLRHAHDAEDACQATFLVLARRAASVRKKDSLGSWLYGVTFRVAANLRRRRNRLRACERPPVDVPQPGGEEVSWREVQTLLDEGLQALPEHLRAPLLCCLEGKTRDEAARQLGCTLESLRGRLERGRKLLRRRLARRGVDLSSALLAAFLSRGNAAPAPRSGRPAALAEEVLNSLVTRRGSIVTVLLLAAGISFGSLIHSQAQRPVAAPTNSAATERTRGTPRTDLHGDPLPTQAVARIGTVRWRHGGPVFFVGRALKSKQLITASQDGWFRVWDADTGKELRRFGRPSRGRPGGGPSRGRSVFFDGAPAIVALSPDGRLLAAGDQTGIARVWQDEGLHVWDVDSGKELWSTKREGAAAGLAFSADGRTLVTWGWQGLRQWDAVSGKRLALPSPSERGIRVWDLTTGKPGQLLRSRLPGSFAGYLHALAFSPDGKTLASKGANRIIRLWDTSTGKELRPLQGPFDPSGAGEVVNGHPPNLASGLVFSADGKVLFSGSSKSLVRRWEVATGKELTAGGHTEGIQTVVVAPDGRTVTTQAADGIRQWDRVSGKEIHRLRLPQGAALATLSPNGRALAFIVDHSVRLWDLTRRREVRRWCLPGPEHKTYHPSWLYQMCFSANGRGLAARSYEGTVLVWATATGKEVRAFSPETGRSRVTVGLVSHDSAFALSPDGRTLARVEIIGPSPLVKAGDRLPSKRIPQTSVLRLYDVASGRKLHQSPSTVAISAAVFSPDGRTLATVNRDHTLSLWEVSTGRLRSTLKGGGSTLTFSPDGRVLAVGDGLAIVLWRVLSGKELAVFRGHVGDVTALAFAPDGKVLLSGSTDTTLLVWDVAKQTETAGRR